MQVQTRERWAQRTHDTPQTDFWGQFFVDPCDQVRYARDYVNELHGHDVSRSMHARVCTRGSAKFDLKGVLQRS